MNFYSGDLGSGEVNSTLETAANDDQLTAQLIFWKNNPHHAPSDNIFLRCQIEKRAHKRRPSLLRQDPAPPGKTQLSWGGEGRRQRFLSFPCWGPEWIKGFLFQGTLSKIFGTHFNPILKLPPPLSKSIFNKLVTNLPSGCLKKNLIAQQQSQLLGNCSGTLNLYWQMFEINWSCSNSERKERLIFSEPGFLTFFFLTCLISSLVIVFPHEQSN